MDAWVVLKKVRSERPLVHHITNWVTIYDCANIVKVLGASPVMAHDIREVEEMTAIASSLVLNIGTLTAELVDSMQAAGRIANKKGIPVLLDVCGAGATSLRNSKSFEILNDVHIDFIKGNASEVARIAGERVDTRGVDSTAVDKNLSMLAEDLSKKRKCTVVITGRDDIIAGKGAVHIIRNGHEMMSRIVGTGCMAASVIGTFAAVEKDAVKAAASALSCFGIAGELAALDSTEPGTFKVRLFDHAYSLDEQTIKTRQRIT
ncbi:MAG: hydroxyethylthiazole kinase [Candidatus Omnitrophica bacterium]|nr:hydroxyethylthiazole kinase [Candidatus Omnitrophota bacterium]